MLERDRHARMKKAPNTIGAFMRYKRGIACY